MTDRVPGKNQRAESTAGVAESVFAAFFPNAAADVTVLVRGVAGRIHDDGNELRVVISLAMKQKEACLARDRNAHFVGQLEPTDPLETLLRQKYLCVTEQLRLIGWREPSEDWKIALEDRSPRWRCCLRTQACATSGFEQVEYHHSMISARRRELVVTSSAKRVKGCSPLDKPSANAR